MVAPSNPPLARRVLTVFACLTLASLVVATCGGGGASPSASPSAAAAASDTPSPSAVTDSAPPSVSTAPAAESVDLNANVYYMGYEITLQKAAFDPTTREVRIEGRFANTGSAVGNLAVIADRSQVNLSWNNQFLPIWFDSSGSLEAPAGTTVVGALEGISGMPDGFTLDAATLVFGTPDQHQAMVPLQAGAAGQSDKPRDFAVTGSVTVDKMVKVTFTKGQVVPATCGIGPEPDNIGFQPAKKTEESILIWVDEQNLDSTYDTAAKSHLTAPDGTTAPGNPGGSYLASLETKRDGVLCYTVPSPAKGTYVMNWGAERTDATATFELAVP